MGKSGKIIAIFSLLVLTAVMAGCGTEHSNIYGTIADINTSAVTLNTGTCTASSDPEEFAPNGKVCEYPLSDAINTADLQEGLLVKITLDHDLVTAIQIVHQQVSAENANPKKTQHTPAQLRGACTADGTDKSISDKNYSSSAANENTILVTNKGSLSLKGGTLTKSGDTTSYEDSSSCGLNAIFAVSKGSSASVDGTKLTSSGKGATGMSATGKGSSIKASNFKIYTTGDHARGLDAACDAAITASKGEITTKGAHCAPVSAALQNGSVSVRDTSISAEGDDSPCIYSSGAVKAFNLTGSASGSQIAVIEGNSSIALTDCLLQGAGRNGILFHQSASGSAAKSSASFKAADSTLTTTSRGPMFSIAGTNVSITLKNTELYYSSGILTDISAGHSSSEGKGGDVALKAFSQTLKGDVCCDKGSSASLKLQNRSSFTGAVNQEDRANFCSVSLDKNSIWHVTGDSYVSKITNKDTRCRNIKSKGFTVYYDKDNCSWLKGRTIALPGGGKLAPAA